MMSQWLPVALLASGPGSSVGPAASPFTLYNEGGRKMSNITYLATSPSPVLGVQFLL